LNRQIPVAPLSMDSPDGGFDLFGHQAVILEVRLRLALAAGSGR
jgi:hypothetical protein